MRFPLKCRKPTASQKLQTYALNYCENGERDQEIKQIILKF